MTGHTGSFLGVDHVGVAVRDLDAAVRTYRDMLGFSITGGESLPDRGLDVQFVDTGGARIELIAASRDNSEISKFLDTRGEGIHHVCVRVADIDQSVAEMVERGAQVVGGVRAGAHNTRVAFVHPKSAHGVLLELVEHGQSAAGGNPDTGKEDKGR